MTSPLLFGAGYLDSKGNYQLSARGSVIETVTSLYCATAGSRSILNLRDESHLCGDVDKLYRRLHITCRDANVSQQATFLKTASTSILLAMIEAGWGKELGQDYPNDPVTAMKSLNFDPWGNQSIVTSSGLVTALDIQRRIVDAVGKFIERQMDHQELPSWVFEAYGKWIAGLDDLTRFRPNEWSDGSYWIDWKAKWHFLRDYQDRYPDAPNEELQALSMSYHDIDPTSLGHQMMEEELLARPISEAQLRKATTEASSHRRAIERVEILTTHKNTSVARSVQWSGYQVDGRFRPFAFT
ncbi:MAG: uncharacterized protein K0S20_627, partial [Patescibacteria group bacterium]|jgi:proteasome accessory factor A|nr:uncharacterized protein [Patescibacteria group bacterium]